MNACTRCRTARCCIVFDPELTGPDLARLAAGLGVPPLSFCRLAPVRADEAGPDGVRLGGIETWELRLRRTLAGEAAAGAGGARRCLFLLHLGPGVERCGVYDLRPMLCRTFPAARVGAELHPGPAPAVCPDEAWEGLPPLTAGAQAALHATFDGAETERARWRSFLDRWHEAPRQAALAARTTAEATAHLIGTIVAVEAASPRGPFVPSAVFEQAFEASSGAAR